MCEFVAVNFLSLYNALFVNKDDKSTKLISSGHQSASRQTQRDGLDGVVSMYDDFYDHNSS